MQTKFVAWGLALAVATPGSSIASASPVDGTPQLVSRAEQFRRGLAELARKHEVPGVSVAVYSSRGLEAAEAIGARRAGEAAPVELGDRFFIGSVTKPMTATLAAAMVDAGHIAWTTTPALLWPREARRMHPALRRVTLAQLLSHRAGIQPFTSDNEFTAALPPPLGTRREQRDTFVRWLLARPPASPIGEYKYSNAGFGIAAAMLEKAGGRPWEDLLRERIFRRLGLPSCGFGWPRSTGDQPHGHRLANGRFIEGSERASDGLPASIAPAGNVHCNMADLARFGSAHLTGLLGEPAFLRPESLRALHPPASEGVYSLGWNRQPEGSSHQGGVTQGWHALLFVAPPSDIVVAVGINAREPGRTDILMEAVTQLAFDTFASRSKR